MKYLLGIVLVVAAAYMTYAYVNSENPKTDTTIVGPNFSGKWEIFLNPTSGATCVTSTVDGNVSNGEMKSIMMSADGVQSGFNIIVDSDGIIRNKKSPNLTSFEGSIHGGVGTGKWSDKYACAGTFLMKRPVGQEEAIPEVQIKNPSKGDELNQQKL